MITSTRTFGAGEGTVGISWAFFVAGVPSMVASQWKPDERSALSASVVLVGFVLIGKAQTTFARKSVTNPTFGFHTQLAESRTKFRQS
jgi:hypothetical protein